MWSSWRVIECSRWQLLTKQLLEHLSVIAVLLQVFDYDPIFLQFTVDPVNQNLDTQVTILSAVVPIESLIFCFRARSCPTFRRSLNLRLSRDVGSSMILSAFSSGPAGESEFCLVFFCRNVDVDRSLNPSFDRVVCYFMYLTM